MTNDFDENTDDREESVDLPESDSFDDSVDDSPEPSADEPSVDEGNSADDSLNDGSFFPRMSEAVGDTTSLLTMAGIAVLAFSFALNASLLIWRPTKVVIQNVPNGDVAAEETVRVDADEAGIARRARFREGDGFIREGNYNDAIHRYLEVGTDSRAAMPLRLQYRLGICHEELGLFDDALSYYRQMINRKVPARLQWLSRVSQARVWLRQRDPRRARQVLSGSILQNDLEDVADHPVSAEAMYLFALASARIETADDDPDPGEPWVVPSPSHWPVQSLLTWADARPEKEPRSLTEDRAIVVIPEPDATQPLLKRVALKGEGVDVRSLLDQVGTQTGQPVTLTPEAQATLEDHVVNASTTKVPASVLLTALTEPYELTWTPVAGTLVVSAPSDAADPDEDESDGDLTEEPLGTDPIGRIARETLATALALYPGHRLSTAARLEYGNVHFKEADYQNASLYYQDLVSSSSDPQTMSAAFNLGLSHRRMGNLRVARQNLFLVVDGIPEHPLSAVASYLVGRMLLDEGNYSEAVSPLDASARARIDDRSRSAAAVYAAIAHLLQDNYHQAGAVLFANRTGLADEAELRDAAAFLNSYTRYLTLRGNRDEQRAETVYLFRSLFALGPSPTWMGSYGMLLVGRAYRDLGMSARMTDIFTNARDEAQGIILAEMKYWITVQKLEAAETSEDSGTARAAALQELRQLVTVEGANQWGQQAMLKLAEVELDENRVDECIQHCRRLLAIEDAQVFDVLRLMGRAYEVKGDARAAAFCFAGQIPPA